MIIHKPPDRFGGRILSSKAPDDARGGSSGAPHLSALKENEQLHNQLVTIRTPERWRI